MDPSDHLDISSEPLSRGDENDQIDSQGKRFLGVHFACCNVYTRVYRKKGESYYEGRCPRCFGKVRFVEGQGGRRERFFRAEG